MRKPQMSIDAKRKDPNIVNRILTLVESGSLPNEIIAQLSAEKQSADEPFENENFSDQIKIISQALAFRTPISSELPALLELLNNAYKAEIVGPECFRQGPVFSVDEIAVMLADPTYKWLIVEAPNGRGVISDGSIIGCCCFSTDGVSRRNGLEPFRNIFYAPC